MARRVGLLIALLWTHSAIAATYTVTTLGDSAGSCTGASPSFSCTTLRAAITAANATTTVDDTVQFSVSGTVTLASTLPSITDTVVINGGSVITLASGPFESLIFNGAGASNSQLLNMGFSGTTNPASTVRVSSTSNVLVQGNTITMGVTTGSAILVGDSTNVTVNNNVITGGVYSINYYNTASSPYLANPAYSGSITENTITGASSGIALYTANNILVDGNNVINSTGIGIRLGMQFDGPYGASNTTITNNTITGGNSSGVSVTGYGGGAQMGVFNGNLIQGNTIINNSGAGVRLPSTALIQTNGNVVTGNTITGNGGDGVAISGANAADNIIYANTNISGNGGLGIDLADNGVTANDAGDTDTGPNGLQNFPVITSMSGDTVKFVLDTAANANGYRIDFYNNPGGLDPTGYGEGQAWLGSCTVASPSATVPSNCTITGVSAATLRMTATRCLTAACTTGATSEFNGPSPTDLAITKTDGQTIYSAGQTLTYTIVATNNGTAVVSDAIFTDPVVAGLSITGVTCGSPSPGSQCPAAGSTTTALMQGTGIVIPVLAPGGSVTFAVTATATTGSGSLTNTASIAAPVGVTETLPANNTASDTNGLQPDFGTCDARMWLSQSPNSTTNTTLYDISTAANPFTYPAIGQGSTGYNATGYNPADNYQYAISYGSAASNSLIRVGSDGSTADLGVVTGLPADFYNSGEFSPAGVYYVIGAGNGADNRLYAINVSTRSATLVNMSATIQPSDIAWVNGLLYTVNTAGQLYSINPTSGAVTAIGSPTGSIVLGAMFGAPNGLFGSANNGGFYQIDLLTGARTLVSGAPSAAQNDGSHCPTANITFPADLAVTKTDNASVYTPGTNVAYTIVVTNNGPFGVQNATVSDPLPAGIATASWTCANTSGGAACGAASGTGALNDTGLDLPASAVATYTVTLTVPADFTGDLVNTVTVDLPPSNTDPAPGNNTATDTNVATGSITIVKVAVPNNAQDFAFTTTGTGLSNFSLDDDADATLLNTQTFTGLAAGSYTVTEAALAGWSLTGLVCVDPDSSTTVDVGARIANIDLDAGENITCTFTNTLQSVDLGVVKTASPTIVASGDVVTYTLTVTNSGPGTAINAVLTDTPDTGLDCSTPSTTATCTATGGASCPGPSTGTTVPVGSLTGAGITLPTVPMGGQVVVQMQCTVTASGLPPGGL